VNRLYFAAKAPLPGQVKTRLGRTIGMDAAATLYAAFVVDLSVRFLTAPFDVAWYVAPGSWPHLRSIIGTSDRVRIQEGESWGIRQANLFRATAGVEGSVVLAATDSPQLRPALVEAAFAALQSHDVVFGPTLDGGYYLVGMTRFHDLFSSVAMSTSSAFEQALTIARDQGLSVALLDPETDVDTSEDLEQLARELAGRDDLGLTAGALSRILRQEVAA
jgi:uncharacterized protein